MACMQIALYCRIILNLSVDALVGSDAGEVSP